MLDTIMDNNHTISMPICVKDSSLMHLRQPAIVQLTNVSVLDAGNLSYSMSSATTTTHHASAAAAASSVDFTWVEIVLPIICFLGIIGNVLNLLVLTRRRLMLSMDRLEKSANYGLIALALSDMLFCAVAFMQTFIWKGSGHTQVYKLYYRVYGVGLINLFLMVSTWLIVSMAVNRYIVVVYPLHARQTLGTGRTVTTIVLVYVISAIFTLPYFIHVGVVACVTPDGLHKHEFADHFSRTTVYALRFYMRWIWPVIAGFVPILVLAFCNARLIRELRVATIARRRTCRGQVVRDPSHKVTLTLVIIVLMLFFLVSPSEILKYVNPFKTWGKVGYMVADIANMMQTINFAFNFVLYCVVNANFRQTMKSMFSRCLKDKGEKTEMETMLTRINSYKMDRSLVVNDEIE